MAGFGPLLDASGGLAMAGHEMAEPFPTRSLAEALAMAGLLVAGLSASGYGGFGLWWLRATCDHGTLDADPWQTCDRGTLDADPWPACWRGAAIRLE